MTKTITKLVKKIKSLFMCIIIILMLLALFPSAPVQAATSTIDNPIIFTVRGTVGNGGVVQYNIVIEDVYAGGDMTYQGFTITYPAEFKINYPVGLSTAWNLFENISTSPKSINAIIKTGTRSPAQIKTDLEGIYFTLATTDMFPPDGSTVSVSATKEKVAFFQDDEGYVHYYEWVPFSVNASGQPVAGNNPATGVNKNWWQAYNLAHNKTMQDPRYPDDPTKVLHGYLATITSAEEQMLLYSAIADWSGWLGGTRQVLTTGTAKIQGNAGIPEVVGSYSFAATQNRWYWADGPEAWTVYNTATAGYLAGGPAYQYYPKGMTTVPANAWSVYNAVTHVYTYWNDPANPDGSGVILPSGQTFVPDPNRGQPVVPLVFYNNNVYKTTAPVADYPVTGVYHNWNNPIGGTVHIYNSNKVLAGTLPGGGAEPNGTTTEYCLQFAYPSGTFTVNGVSTTKPDTWNDYAAVNASNLYGYFIEYGGYQGDPKAEELVGSDVTTTSEVELVMPVIIQYRSTVQNEALGTYNQITGVGTTLDRVITYETHLPYTAERNLNPLAASIPGYTPYGYKFFGSSQDEDMLTLRGNGDVDGFHSTSTQRIVFLYKPDSYTLTFDGNFTGWSSADVSPGSKTVYYDSPYGELATARRPGYIHDGWTIDNDNLTLPITSELRIPGTGNRTVYAKWTEKANYTVYYDLNGGTGNDAPLNSVAWTQSGLLPANPTRYGYIFTGWNVLLNGSKQGVTDTDTYGVLAANDVETSITLQAQWMDENRILVIYQLNGADVPSSIPDNDVFVTDYVEFPIPTRAGYIFNGWQVKNDGSGNIGATYAAGTSTEQYQDLAAPYARFIILEAQWLAKTYTVDFDKNDGSGAYGTPRAGVTWYQNGMVPPNGGNPTRDHYIFMGWNTGPDGDGVTAYVGSTYAQLAGADTVSSVTLYAQWIPEKAYFVSYDTNGGMPSGIADKTSVYFDTDDLLPASNPAPPTGYTFEGWSVSYNGTKAGVTSADTFGDLADDINAGYIILKAQYAPKGNLTVIYNLNGHTQAGYPGQKPLNPPTDPYVVWTQSNLLPAADPVRSGWTFLGWNTAANGLGIAATNTDTYGALAGGNDNLTSVTLYAQWQQIIPDTYTVIYNANGGAPVANVILNSVNAIVPDDAPTSAPAGYYFSHWYVEDNGYGQGTTMSPNGTTVTFEDLAYGSGAETAKFIKLKAYYIEISNFEVVYDLNYIGAPDGGIVHTETNVSWSQAGFVPYTCYRPGYNLIGWKAEINSAEIFVLPGTQYKTLAGGVDTVASVTLKAQWEEASFYVRYDLNGISVPGGTDAFDQRTVGFDDTGLIPNYELKRTGYTHTGWNVSENGSKMNVISSDSFRTLANPGAAYITLQAQWAPKEYVVYYDTAGGDLNTTSQGVSWWSINLLPDAEPVRYGYTFDGWKLSKVENDELSELEIESGSYITNSIKYSDLANVDGYDSGHITLQAHWTANTYEVIYDLNSATTPASIDSKMGIEWTDDGLLPTGPNPARTGGYKFTGWKLVKIGDNTVDGIIVMASHTFGYVAGNDHADVDSITLQAQWRMSDGYSVRYDFDGGTPSSAVSDLVTCLDWTDTGLIPTDITITKDGYSFTGAWELIARDSVMISPAMTVTAANSYADLAVTSTIMELTLRPVYIEDADVTINYSQITVDSDGTTPQTAANGGSISKVTETVGPASGTPSVTATANAGYTLVGWFNAEDTDFETPIATTTAFTPPTDSKGLNVAGSYVALFKENSDVTINYDQVTVDSDGVTTQTASNGGTISKTSDVVAPATGSPTVTATANAGYTFMGWYVANTTFSSALETAIIFTPAKSSGLNVAGDYVALFKENANVTITYTAVGGSVDSPSESIAPATGTAAGATAAPDSDEIFFGWYEASDPLFTNKLSGDLYFAPEKVNGVYVSGDYVAWFADETMLVAYWAVNGTVSVGLETIDAVSGSMASPNPGYDFDGWYDADDTEYKNRLSANYTFIPHTDEHGWADPGKYVALFLEKENVTINYMAVNGNVDNDTESVAPATGTASGSTATASLGYHFDGWYRESDTTFSNKLSSDLTFVPETNSDKLNVAENYVARFLEDPEVVIYYTALPGGSVSIEMENVAPATGTVQGSTATAGSGYSFDGWYEESDTTFSNKLSSDPAFIPEPDEDGLNAAGRYLARFTKKDVPPIPTPYTGDSLNLMPWIVAQLVAVLGMGGVIKREKVKAKIKTFISK